MEWMTAGIYLVAQWAKERAAEEGLPIFLSPLTQQQCSPYLCMGNGTKNALGRFLTTKNLLLFPCHKTNFSFRRNYKQFQKAAAFSQRLLVAYSFYCKDISTCTSALMIIELLIIFSTAVVTGTSPLYRGTLRCLYSRIHDLLLPRTLFYCL